MSHQEEYNNTEKEYSSKSSKKRTTKVEEWSPFIIGAKPSERSSTEIKNLNPRRPEYSRTLPPQLTIAQSDATLVCAVVIAVLLSVTFLLRIKFRIQLRKGSNTSVHRRAATYGITADEIIALYANDEWSENDWSFYSELLVIALRGNEFELTDFLNKRRVPIKVFKPVVDGILRVGNNENRSVVYRLLLHVAEQLKKDDEDNITEVWPAYEEQNPNNPIFVVLTRTNIQGEWYNFKGFKLFLRRYDLISEEAAKVINSKLVKDNPFDTADFERLKPNTQWDNIIETHSNITIMNACPCRSKNGGNEIYRETCIVIHCLVKGLIPFHEKQFPKNISGIPIDVREGYMTVGMNQKQDGNVDGIEQRLAAPCYQMTQNGVTVEHLNKEAKLDAICREVQSLQLTEGIRSTEFNKKLLMGTGISKTSSTPYTGTLGGFVDLPQGGIGFLTCAHVVGLEKDEPVAQPSYGEFSPSQRLPRSICGHVEKAVFNRGQCDLTGVDAAVVRIKERQPTDGDFIWTSPESLDAAGFSSSLKFTSGNILTLEQVKQNRRHDLIKVGSQSGLTRGSFYLSATFVRKSNPGMTLPWGKTVEFFNQMEIQSHEGSKAFFDLGDSGSLVFMNMKDDELYCIGMAVGKTSYNTCLVTPISNVLESLGLPGQLKNFGMPNSTTIASTSQNHDRNHFFPNFHLNLRSQLTKRRNRIVRK